MSKGGVAKSGASRNENQEKKSCQSSYLSTFGVGCGCHPYGEGRSHSLMVRWLRKTSLEKIGGTGIVEPCIVVGKK